MINLNLRFPNVTFNEPVSQSHHQMYFYILHIYKVKCTQLHSKNIHNTSSSILISYSGILWNGILYLSGFLEGKPEDYALRFGLQLLFCLRYLRCQSILGSCIQGHIRYPMQSNHNTTSNTWTSYNCTLSSLPDPYSESIEISSLNFELSMEMSRISSMNLMARS